MTTVFEAEEFSPGRWRMVRFRRDGTPNPTRYPLCGHKHHATSDEARDCPSAVKQMPPSLEKWRRLRRSGRIDQFNRRLVTRDE